jgi:hypothetical protein
MTLGTKYDMWKHGVDVRVYDLRRLMFGTVKDIKETDPEWIEPFVLFDGETEVKLTNPSDLVLADK